MADNACLIAVLCIRSGICFKLDVLLKEEPQDKGEEISREQAGRLSTPHIGNFLPGDRGALFLIPATVVMAHLICMRI